MTELRCGWEKYQMKDEVGGWLSSFQPHLLTVAAATLQSKLGRVRKPGGRGCPTLGEGAPGGRGGRRPGRVQYWQGKEQHCTASRPSRPPGALESLSLPPGPLEPRDRGALKSLGHLRGAPEPGYPKSEKGGKRERVRREGELLVPRKATFQHQSSARACSLNTQTERRGAIAMVTGVPATELNGCCLAILGVGVWCRPLKYLWAS